MHIIQVYAYVDLRNNLIVTFSDGDDAIYSQRILANFLSISFDILVFDNPKSGNQFFVFFFNLLCYYFKLLKLLIIVNIYLFRL